MIFTLKRYSYQCVCNTQCCLRPPGRSSSSSYTSYLIDRKDYPWCKTLITILIRDSNYWLQMLLSCMCNILWYYQIISLKKSKIAKKFSIVIPVDLAILKCFSRVLQDTWLYKFSFYYIHFLLKRNYSLLEQSILNWLLHQSIIS